MKVSLLNYVQTQLGWIRQIVQERIFVQMGPSALVVLAQHQHLIHVALMVMGGINKYALVALGPIQIQLAMIQINV